MKKTTYVVSMLLVALSTAGAMLAGQSYAASGAEQQGAAAKQGNCVSTINYDALTQQQFDDLVQSLSGG